MSDGGRVSRFLERVARAGALPTDDEDERLRKAVLLLLPGLVLPLAVIWVVTYFGVGRPLSAAIPLGYQVGSAVGIVFMVRTKRFRLFRAAQLVMILLLPFLLQWSLGGFVASSGVMLWAVLAPFGAVMFYGARQAIPWLLLYLALTVVSGVADARLSVHPAAVPQALRTAFFVLNIAAVSGVTFFLLHYFVRERERARARSERLLLNVLPAPIAERLKASEGIIADAFDEATVMFADIVGFTPMSERISPHDLVALLDQVFSEFDALASEHGLEKIKTVGDAYMVAGGIPEPRPDHVGASAEMALALRERCRAIGRTYGASLDLRIGMDVGPVVAGVIGRSKFIYDLWGDTVNTASRMESHGLPGQIQVTERAARRLRERYVLRERGTVDVKGKGPMTTYLLVGRRSAGQRWAARSADRRARPHARLDRQ